MSDTDKAEELTTEQKKTADNKRSGLMLLLFGLLPISIFLLAMSIPILSGLRGLTKLREHSVTERLTFEYSETLDKYREVKAKISLFVAAKEKTMLQLTVADLNALIAHDETLKKIKGFLKVTKIELEPNTKNWARITADISLPLDEVLKESGRYLNGQIVFSLYTKSGTMLSDEQPLLRVSGFIVKEKLLELEIIQSWGEKDLAALWLDTAVDKPRHEEYNGNILKVKSVGVVAPEKDGKPIGDPSILVIRNYNPRAEKK